MTDSISILIDPAVSFRDFHIFAPASKFSWKLNGTKFLSNFFVSTRSQPGSVGDFPESLA